MDDPRLPLEHPANARVIAYFHTIEPAAERVAAEPRLESGSGKGLVEAHGWFGAHPDCLSQLWGPSAATLPEPCQWVVHGVGVLAHPHSGVIFAFALGTNYVLRLPAATIAVALRAGVQQVKHSRGTPSIGIRPWTWDLTQIGHDWCFGSWRVEEQAWLRDAFDFAAAGWPSAQ